MVNEKFPPDVRIRRGAEFALVLKKGQKRRNRYFTLHILLSERGFARLGVIASRRVGGAVARNRAKRLLREAFRRNHSNFSPGLDLVAVANGPIVKARLEDVERALRDAVDGMHQS